MLQNKCKNTVKDQFCIDCDKLLYKYGKAKRCYSCNSIFQMSKRDQTGKNNPNYKGNSINTNCYICSKEIFIFLCNLKEKNFCDRKCTNKYRSFCMTGEKNINYKHGKGNAPYPLEFNKSLKFNIRKRDNFTCQHCRLTEKESKIKYNEVLHVHHLDFNKTNCKIDNLITLCRSCNSKMNYNQKANNELRLKLC